MNREVKVDVSGRQFFKESSGVLILGVFAVVITLAMAGCRSLPQSYGTAAETQKQNAEHPSPFPTFKETGQDICTDGNQRPVILLFSVSSCPHCEWVGPVFDAVAKSYVDKKLIEAHHFDVETGDDLLTEAVETRIPDKFLSIGKRGDPKGYMPYFNFGCRYDRIGTGYEEENDLAAEAEEMCRVIEALLPEGSTGG